jgi:hypothetical protein
MITLLAAAAMLAAYDCSMDQPWAMDLHLGKPTAVQLQLPEMKPESWRFSLRIVKDSDRYFADVDWPQTEVGLNGRMPAFPTEPNSYAFAGVGVDHCRFTNQMCVSTANLIDTGLGFAQLLILPSALIDFKDHTHAPFPVVISGKCQPKAERR